MESNWRFNVADLGFSDSTIRLCARYFDPLYPDQYLIAFKGVPEYQLRAYIQEYLDGSIAFSYLGGPYLGRFPAGQDVEPD